MISRGSVYECVSILEIILDENHIETTKYDYFMKYYEEISKMLLGLIRSQNTTKSQFRTTHTNYSH